VNEIRSSGDLEAILLSDETSRGADESQDPSVRARSRRWWPLAVLAAFSAGVASGVALSWGETPDPTGPVASPSIGPTAPTVTAPHRARVLRVLFTHVTPRGGVVVARRGSVASAEAYGCLGVGPDPPPVDDPSCRDGVVDGIQFDFSVSGGPWYRLTVLDTRVGRDRGGVLQPVVLERAVRAVRADGTTGPPAASPPIRLAAFRSVDPVAIVRVQLNEGGMDEMRAVGGWSAFAAQGDSPFAFVVEGIDDDGRLVARTQVRRWH
jgi:hypothetical protein